MAVVAPKVAVAGEEWLVRAPGTATCRRGANVVGYLLVAGAPTCVQDFVFCRRLRNGQLEGRIQISPSHSVATMATETQSMPIRSSGEAPGALPVPSPAGVPRRPARCRAARRHAARVGADGERRPGPHRAVQPERLRAATGAKGRVDRRRHHCAGRCAVAGGRSRGRGPSYPDAPVTGSATGGANGALPVMASREPAAFAAARQVLDQVAPKVKGTQ